MRIFALLLLLLNLGHLGWYLLEGRAAVPDVTVRSPSREAAQTLVLLSETEAPPPAPANSPAPPAAVQGGESCLEIGVFAGAGEAERFVGGARALGLSAELKPVEVREQPDYWVHMPPFVSEAAAQRRLAELKARNIDSYLISGGELDRGISLGLFSRRESAQRMQEELAAQGYDSEIREVQRSYTELWVESGTPPRDAQEAREWAEFLAGWPGLRQVEKLCETIARPSQFP